MTETTAEDRASAIPAPVDRGDDPRMSIVLRTEWTMLAARYVIFFVVLGAHAVGYTPPHLPNLIAFTLFIGIHNAFSHWILYSERTRLFLRPVNFVLYLGGTAAVVGLTGGEESPVALLFALFVVGYCAYAPGFLNTLSVTLICCATYALTVVLGWLLLGVGLVSLPVVLHVTAILFAGWLVSSLGDSMRNMTLEAENQALALASSETTLRTILERMPHPIFVYDEDEFVSHINDRACVFLGLARDEVLGRRFRSFLFDDGTLPNKLAALRARGEYHGEVIIVTETGDERDCEVHVRSFIRDNRRFFVSMLHDVTVQKELQEATRLANLRLEQINRELQQINDLRAAFLTNVAQRLRSPLSAIVGYTELMVDEELGSVSGEQRQALHSCRNSALRVLKVVDELYEMEIPDQPRETSAATNT